MPTPKVCFTTTMCFSTMLAGYEIKLMQHGKNRYSVSYGQQFNCDLTYSEACSALGASIMHALACEGKLDNEEP